VPHCSVARTSREERWKQELLSTDFRVLLESWLQRAGGQVTSVQTFCSDSICMYTTLGGARQSRRKLKPVGVIVGGGGLKGRAGC